MHFALRDYFNYKCKNIDNLYDIGIISWNYNFCFV
jgi:hypothetical protein